ncbi:MAG TPA: hypothetical protein DIU15_09330 [Deltaproteobacteria bacterium]|nr:hypothetical protein [Deltaproteobacteria bacterium]HCP46232.1 hypothetical protein [Deltaproteobacteria bacterium]
MLAGCYGVWGSDGEDSEPNEAWAGNGGDAGGGDGGGNGDAGDDDDVADDDDGGDAGGPTSSYPEEEAFFALAVGNLWTYDEQVSGVPEVLEDGVEVEIVGRVAGPDMNPPMPENMVVFEFEVNRDLGADETHWYGIDGSAALKWVKSRVAGDFDDQEFPGDESVILRSGASDALLVGQEYEGALLLADIEGRDYAVTSSTLTTYFYGLGQEVESLENDVFEEGNPVGQQYWKAQWGLLGFNVAQGSSSTQWEITGCSPCPPSAGL